MIGKVASSKSAKTGSLGHQAEVLEHVVALEEVCVEVLAVGVVTVAEVALEVMVDEEAMVGPMGDLLAAATATLLLLRPAAHHRTLSPIMLPLVENPASSSTSAMYVALHLASLRGCHCSRDLAALVH